MTQDVHIIGIGAFTPLGACAASSAAAIRAGLSRYEDHPFAVNSVGEPLVVARIPFLPEDIAGVDRYIAMVHSALQEALQPVASLTIGPIPLVLGLPPKRPGRPTDLEVRLERLIPAMEGLACMIQGVSTIPTGHASGLMALEAGLKNIQSGLWDLCIIGGADSYLEPETLEWLDAHDQLHGAGEMKNAFGFTPGEGAGFCLLASGKVVNQHRLESLSRIVSVSTAQEPNPIKTDSVCVGVGLSKAFRKALQDVPSDVKIDRLICDQNGEIYRADEFGFTLARTSNRFVNGGAFTAPAECWGDVGAASGPLFAILTVAAGLRGYAKGPHTLLSTSSEEGERATAVLQTEIRQRGR